ncbi:hypothetical protein ACFL1X_03740 [Candidatus Hydrogenedentota bacterium]
MRSLHDNSGSTLMMVLFYMCALFALVAVISTGVVHFHATEDRSSDEQEVLDLAASGVEMAIWRLSTGMNKAKEYDFQFATGSIHVKTSKKSSDPLTYSVESTARLLNTSPKAPVRRVRALVEKRGTRYAVTGWTSESVFVPFNGGPGE